MERVVSMIGSAAAQLDVFDIDITIYYVVII